jgi:hypothetical protein
MLWVRDGFKLFARRPLAFTSLFVLFLLAAVVMALVPLAGGLLQMMSLPLLSLGFMVAAQSALLSGEVKPAQFIEPLRGDPERRRALLMLCVIYGVGALAVLLLCDALSDEALLRLQKLLARPGTTQAEIDALLGEPGVMQAVIAGGVLGTAITVPFWHAPALVHWGHQGVGQALFSSTLAMWRNKGAFTVYTLTWFGLIVAFSAGVALLLGLFGLMRLAGVLALPAGLVLSAVFYVSLLFTFNDCFGNAEPGVAAAER